MTRIDEDKVQYAMIVEDLFFNDDVGTDVIKCVFVEDNLKVAYEHMKQRVDGEKDRGNIAYINKDDIKANGKYEFPFKAICFSPKDARVTKYELVMIMQQIKTFILRS